MRSILVTVLLLIVVIGLYQILFAGEEGMLDQLEQREETVRERIVRLNP
jgi:Tfp pilus assembly protein PilO